MIQSELVTEKGRHVCHLCGLKLANAKALTTHLSNKHEPDEEPPPLSDSDVKEDIKQALEDAKEAHGSDDWLKLLPAVLYTMRTTVSRTRGASPFQIIFGREPNTSLNPLFGGFHHRSGKFDDTAEYLLVRSRQEEAADLFAHNNLQKAT